MWKLVIEDDEGKRTIVPLTRESYTLGRKEGNSIRLTERNVSRDHAKIRKKPNGAAPAADGSKPTYALHDLESYNGVYVNGLRVAQAQDLQHGDLIQIGDYRIVLQDEAMTDAPTAQVAMSDVKSTIPGGGGRASAASLMSQPNRLVMLAGPTPGAEFALDAEKVMTIGRAEEATISINHNSVSRIHCEVHSLGDGRFEIVDKGSSNGVRVNAAELRRGIIEFNDVIELGDVKFKFIAAGQVFRPGATESQQLSAIGDRTASSILRPRRTAGALPYLVFGAVVAAGIAVAWALTRGRLDPPIVIQPLPGASSQVSEGSIVAEARRLCEQGEIDGCYEKIATELPEASRARGLPEVRAIAATWADKQLERAVSDPDLSRRRKLLGQIARASIVDDARRKQASEKIAALDEFERASPPTSEVSRDAGTAIVSEADAGRRTHATLASSGMGAAPNTSRATPPPNDAWRQLMLQNNYDAARAILEKRVFANRGTFEEINALKAICKSQGDKACVEHTKLLLGQ